jgi:hypothetical protein
VLHDGLEHLCPLLNDANLYIRGQGLELFLSCTDADTFDWFAPATSDMSKLLHRQLLNLTNVSTFLSNLVANRQGSFPGGSGKALQLLAFWLSWTRALYTSNQQLKLSDKLLSELQLWSIKDPEEGTEEGRKPDEEADLAKTVYDDFSTTQFLRGDITESLIEEENDTAPTPPPTTAATNTLLPPPPPLTTATTSAALDTAQLLSVSGFDGSSLGSKTSSAGSESTTHNLTTAMNSSSLNEIDEGDALNPKPAKLVTMGSLLAMKAEANTLFKGEKLEEALSSYRGATDDLLTLQLQQQTKTATSTSPKIDVAELQALLVNLRTNAATTLWKLAQVARRAEQADGNVDGNVDGDGEFFHIMFSTECLERSTAFCYILVQSACYNLLYSAFCCFLLLSAAFCCFLLPYIAFCYILLRYAAICYQSTFCCVLLRYAAFCCVLL